MAMQPFSGARYLIRGLKLINQPGIRLYAFLPIVITVAAFALTIWLGTVYFGALLDWMLPPATSWWANLLRIVLWPLFVVAVLALLYFGFTFIANLIAAPFNGLLAEKVEAHLLGTPLADTGGLADAFKDFLPAMLNELRKFGYFLIWVVPLLVLYLIPAINLIAPVLWLLFMAWLLALEYVEYPMENHRIRFKQVRQRLRTRTMTGLGFGFAVMVLMAVPLVNLLVIPAAVAGGTALYVERLRSEE